MGRPKKTTTDTTKPLTKKSTNDVSITDPSPDGETVISITHPYLDTYIVNGSKKRNVVVDKYADKKSIKETWLGTEIQCIYKIPPGYSEPDLQNFLEEKQDHIKSLCDRYFQTATIPEEPRN